MRELKMRIDLNGTSTNPWTPFGLTQNPIPQIDIAKYAVACLTIQSLGGEPIPNTEYIRERLKGFPEHFVNLCCDNFVPGKIVTFYVAFEPEDDL